MGMLQKINHNEIELKLEQISTQEIRNIAKENNGSFDNDFGTYFILSVPENNFTFEEMTKSSERLNNYFIGRVAILKTQCNDPITDKEIYSGAQIEDLLVHPQYHGKGYGELLVRTSLDWLDQNGIENCCLVNPVNATECLFKKLEKEGRINLQLLYESNSSESNLRKIYQVNN